jgi:5'(3')-deoxyribonucleotidase
MIIGVDIDDVLADFIGEFTKLANKHHGVPLDTRPVDWSWNNYGLSKAEIDGLWDKIYQTEEFWGSCDKVAGSDSLYDAYRAYKDRFYFVTARKDSKGRPADVQTAAWLWHYFDIDYATVICSVNKGPIAAALGFEAFIDDRPKNCEEVLAHAPDCHVFLKKSHHNASYNAPKGITRVDDFDSFYRIIQDLNTRGVISPSQATVRQRSRVDGPKEPRLRSEQRSVPELSTVRETRDLSQVG